MGARRILVVLASFIELSACAGPSSGGDGPLCTPSNHECSTDIPSSNPLGLGPGGGHG